MAVSVNDRIIRITAAAGQTVFTYDFPILLNTDITILEINGTTGVVTTLVYSVDYTLTGVGADGGGTFVLNSSATLNDIYVAYGNTPYARATDFSGNTEVTTEALNTDYNEGEKQVQQTQTDIDRCLRIPISDDFTNLDTELPIVGDRKGKYLYFNATTGAAEMADGTIVADGVVGPVSSTDNAVARWNGITGDEIQNSGVIIDDSNNITGANFITLANSRGIKDINGNEILLVGEAANAVNYFFMQNSATANALQFAASGDDANINMFVISKGPTGKVFLYATPVNVVSNDATAPGSIVMTEATNNGSETVGFKAPTSLAGSVTWTLPTADGTSGQVLTTDGSATLSFTSNAGGDVTGPAGATDNAIALYDGITGKLIKNSSVIIDALNSVTGVATLEFLTGDGIVDGSGNEQMLFTETASAVNYLNVTNSATGTGPTLSAAGSDPTAELTLSAQGIAAIELHGSPVRIRTDTGMTGALRIYEDPANGSNYVGLVAPASLGSTTDYILPNGDGTSGQTLSTNGTADLSWVTRVAGPGSATDEAIARFDLTTGALLQNSGVLINNTNDVSGMNSLAFATTKGIVDAAANEQLLFTQTASAINYTNITNAAIGNPPIIAAEGDDTNINLTLTGKGNTGGINLQGFPTTVSSNNTATAGAIRIREASTNGTNYVALAAPTVLGADTTWTLPSADGTANQSLVTDGSATLSFATRIVGPGSATDNAMARFDGTTGALLQNSGVIVSDTDVITGVSTIGFDTNGGLNDTNGNELFQLVGVGSAVNHFYVQNSATANSLQFAAVGGDTNISMIISGKGTGRPILSTPTGTIPVRLALTSFGINVTVPSITADRVLTLPDQDIDLTPATQAQQETGTSNSVFVTPGRQVYHASSAKAWIRFTGITTTAITSSFGVTSVSDGGTGTTTINFSTAFSATTAFSGICSCRFTATYNGVANIDTYATGSVRMLSYSNQSAGTLNDMDLNTAVFYGDQ